MIFAEDICNLPQKCMRSFPKMYAIFFSGDVSGPLKMCASPCPLWAASLYYIIMWCLSADAVFVIKSENLACFLRKTCANACAVVRKFLPLHPLSRKISVRERTEE